jgi:RHS repeat-associated protein
MAQAPHCANIFTGVINKLHWSIMALCITSTAIIKTLQVITDANQQVVWMGDYEPFGKLAANQTNSIELFSRFPGQYLDSETGLYYNYFRDYDPSIGRYIESDPIGLDGGINTYGYAYQNPVTHYDPDGKFAFLAPALAGGGTSGGALSGGLGLGSLWMMNESGKRSPEEAALNREKNKYCKSPDPKTGDPREDAKARLSRLQMCLQLRIEYGLKYGNPHDVEITNTTRAVENAKEAVKNACKEECPK